jgi:hypothetical protein
VPVSARSPAGLTTQGQASVTIAACTLATTRGYYVTTENNEKIAKPCPIGKWSSNFLTCQDWYGSCRLRAAACSHSLSLVSPTCVHVSVPAARKVQPQLGREPQDLLSAWHHQVGAMSCLSRPEPVLCSLEQGCMLCAACAEHTCFGTLPTGYGYNLGRQGNNKVYKCPSGFYKVRPATQTAALARTALFLHCSAPT